MKELQMLQFCVHPATAPEKPVHLLIIIGPARQNDPMSVSGPAGNGSRSMPPE